MTQTPLLLTVCCLAAVLFLNCATAQVTQSAVSRAFAVLTRGRTRIPYRDAAASVIISFGKAMPVVSTDAGSVLAAAATYGKGRVVVTDEGLLSDLILANAATWASSDALKGGFVRVAYPATSLDVTQGQLSRRNRAFQPSVPMVLPNIPPGTNLITTGTLGPLSSTQLNALLRFVKAGGGLIVAGPTWPWNPPGPDVDPLVDHPFNRLLINFGIMISQTVISIPFEGIPLSTPPALLNAGNAAMAVVSAASGRLTLTMAEQDTALRMLRLLDSSLRGLWRVARSVILPEGLVAVGPSRPFLPLARNNALKAAVIRMDMAQALGGPPALVKASPLARAFPSLNNFLLPSNAAVTLQIDATFLGYSEHYIYSDPSKPAWRSTGVYLAPGVKATVTIPPTATRAGLSARIGCHTDDLSSKDEWLRPPVVTRSIRLAAASTVVGSGYGGLLYIEVPATAKLGIISVTITGDLIAAPWFQLNTTTDSDWQGFIRNYPAPWAELASPSLILTIPSSLIRTLDSPTALMQWWEQVLAAHARVSGLMSVGPFLRRPERLAADVDITNGYMHAGYPIMVFTDDGAPQALRLGDLQVSGNWAVFHELGHSMQWDDWVLPNTTEASVNIFTVHAMEAVVQLGRDEGYGHPLLLPAARAATIGAYVVGGRNFSRDWTEWTALETYLQLKEAFGWGLFEQLFTEYRSILDTERPGSDDERVQQWVWRSSRTASTDLLAFYEAWGFPILDATRQQVAAMQLPAWTEHPMQ